MKPAKSNMCQDCYIRGGRCRCKICGEEIQKKDLIEIPPANVLGDINYIYICQACDVSLKAFYYDEIRNIKTLETLTLIHKNIDLLQSHKDLTDPFLYKQILFLESALKHLKNENKAKQEAKK